MDSNPTVYLRNARKCNFCGNLTIHPLIYCEKYPGRYEPVIITEEDYLKEKAAYEEKERNDERTFRGKEVK